MKFPLFIFVAIAALGFSAAATAAEPLLAPDRLDAIRSDAAVRVIDIRPAEAYAAGHIPGAVSAPYGQWRGPANNPGELPPVDKLTSLVRSLGIGASTHAVVVSSGANSTDFGASARVYWTLKYLGLTKLSILNGGVKAWADAGLAQDQAVPTPAASAYVAQLDEKLIATRDRVAARVEDPHTRLVDARPLAFYLGKTKAPTAQVPGTIKNAVNLENDKWFKPGTSIFVSTEEAKKIAAALLPEPAAETISFCNTGHWAATDWFALSEVVGQENVRLYPQSMAEWSHDANLPMQNVPGRGSQILDKLKGLVS